ncbi:MAG: hypothetical protein Ct9H300mP1_14810 [Planctomycetaceae bacterium]|nr:MAG: hypothetical protein Ct9H300mP1_14810 [Planctomycetaceae bacterium]
MTLITIPASAQTCSADSTISAPHARYSSSGIPLPCPAPVSTNTRCPPCTNSSTPTGSIATRYSSCLISRGTPTIMTILPPPPALLAIKHQLPPCDKVA